MAFMLHMYGYALPFATGDKNAEHFFVATQDRALQVHGRLVLCLTPA